LNKISLSKIFYKENSRIFDYIFVSASLFKTKEPECHSRKWTLINGFT